MARELNMGDVTPVPNLRARGGVPGWILALLGLLGGALGAGVPVIVTIARMPDGPQFQELTKRMTTIELEIGVMKANQAGADRAHAAQSDLTNFKLDQLLNKRKP